jgi:hypothetical protein
VPTTSLVTRPDAVPRTPCSLYSPQIFLLLRVVVLYILNHYLARQRLLTRVQMLRGNGSSAVSPTFLDRIMSLYSLNHDDGPASSSIPPVSASLLGSFRTAAVSLPKSHLFEPTLTFSSRLLPHRVVLGSQCPLLTESGECMGVDSGVPTLHLGIISFHRVAEYSERLSLSAFSLFEAHSPLTGQGPLSLYAHRSLDLVCLMYWS